MAQLVGMFQAKNFGFSMFDELHTRWIHMALALYLTFSSLRRAMGCSDVLHFVPDLQNKKRWVLNNKIVISVTSSLQTKKQHSSPLQSK